MKSEQEEAKWLLDPRTCGVLLGVPDGRHVRCVRHRGHDDLHQDRNGNWWT